MAAFEAFEGPSNDTVASLGESSRSNMLDNFPLAGEVIAAALGLPLGSAVEDAASLTREEVAQRLKAAELGGLTDAVWQSVLQARENARSHTPVLGATSLPRGREATPTMARTPRISAAGSQDGAESMVQQYVPNVPLMYGRVPRSQESWQYVDGEWASLGCIRAVRATPPVRTQPAPCC